MIRLLLPVLIAISLVFALACQAQAETVAIGVHFITPNEAAGLARSQLSPKGRVIIVESRQMIVVDDDYKHVAAVSALIEKLDKAPQALRLQILMDTADQNDLSSLVTRASRLPGGWVRIHLIRSSINMEQEGRYEIHLISDNGGSIDTGTIQPNRPETLQWLAAHGIPRSESVEMVPITAGFNIEAHMIGKIAHIRLNPWINRQQTQAGLEGQTQMLIGLGSTGNPQPSPSMAVPTMRIYGQPVIGNYIQKIAISEADTELDVPVGQWVTIVAFHAPATSLGQAMLSNDQNGTMKDLLIRLRINTVQ